VSITFMECYVCESDGEYKVEDKDGNEIYLCKTCCMCEECGEFEEDITAANWKPIMRFAHSSAGSYMYEDIAVYCNGCYDLWCAICKSMDCQNRCDQCHYPCSECDSCTCKEA